jgi:hypothetical protein
VSTKTSMRRALLQSQRNATLLIDVPRSHVAARKCFLIASRIWQSEKPQGLKSAHLRHWNGTAEADALIQSHGARNFSARQPCCM